MFLIPFKFAPSCSKNNAEFNLPQNIEKLKFEFQRQNQNLQKATEI